MLTIFPSNIQLNATVCNLCSIQQKRFPVSLSSMKNAILDLLLKPIWFKTSLNKPQNMIINLYRVPSGMKIMRKTDKITSKNVSN